MGSQLEMVRVGASTRGFLLHWSLFVVYLVLSVATQIVVNAFDVTLPGFTGPLVLVGAAAAWWWHRTNAIWIERSGNGITVRTRRWAKYEDLSAGRLRSDGTVTHEFPANVAVSYNPQPQSWWRADRELVIDGHRFSVHPESRELAAKLADSQLWVATEARASR